ncbi:MAG: transporter substrate-binding domain-containing protein [Clostridia bacterium]
MKALQDLEAGGCDVVLVDEVVANYYVTKLEGPYRVLDGSLAAEEYAIGFKKDNTELRDKVEKALKEMAADGTLAKISNEWFGHDVTVIQ